MLFLLMVFGRPKVSLAAKSYVDRKIEENKVEVVSIDGFDVEQGYDFAKFVFDNTIPAEGRMNISHGFLNNDNKKIVVDFFFSSNKTHCWCEYDSTDEIQLGENLCVVGASSIYVDFSKIVGFRDGYFSHVTDCKFIGGETEIKKIRIRGPGNTVFSQGIVEDNFRKIDGRINRKVVIGNDRSVEVGWMYLDSNECQEIIFENNPISGYFEIENYIGDCRSLLNLTFENGELKKKEVVANNKYRTDSYDDSVYGWCPFANYKLKRIIYDAKDRVVRMVGSEKEVSKRTQGLQDFKFRFRNSNLKSSGDIVVV